MKKLKLSRLAKKKHKEDPTEASAWVEETIGRVRSIQLLEYQTDVRRCRFNIKF